ncbi:MULTISPECIES: ABC transporter permease [Roseobacter]|uniref:ABC transporter permease protein n=1 Tax=Roseobacter litoralis (strain ATCC 49566 / DSM 6996 / JCM 21268 / NBRC 15278 / OCh 149) TaxID=391595 RepID=F7ZLD0_ROSLO|nr:MULTISPECIES: ABC transporter permease [Roseobacter]AEI92790.1 putative ABC transporter permease protein [Roseobacter litoralis Och 149]GIT88085.1 ABC transporter permease [Roseobacter sp. OBYS 0001]
MNKTLISWLQILPMATILIAFVGIPLATVVSLSFWTFDGLEYFPDFTLENYTKVFSSWVTWKIFFNTIRYAAITWAIALVIGFTVSYYLVFYVKNLKIQIALFLLCTIPFWTSTVIRMISWIPFLGREGIFNTALMSTGVINQPLEFLLFSDFAVILTYVNLFTLFMIVPIFNAMVKINPNVIEAAEDAGASQLQILWNVIIPLTRTGIALGTIFVVTLVMGDFFIVRVMSGGQSTSVVSAMKNNIDQLFYPQAAAMAVLLIAVVVFMVSVILRVVDVRAELAK